MPEFETIIGRYFTMQVAGKSCRIYVEEAARVSRWSVYIPPGPMRANTAISLCDKAITDNYRVIAFDMPWHGKSNPPAGFREAEYKLTTDLYKETVMAFCCAYELVEPVVMGCSMGGRVVLHLALEQADYFKCVIALEGSDKLDAYYDLDWLHRPDVHGGEVASALVSPKWPRKAQTNTAGRRSGTTCKVAPVFLKATFISIGTTATSMTDRL